MHPARQGLLSAERRLPEHPDTQTQPGWTAKLRLLKTSVLVQDSSWLQAQCWQATQRLRQQAGLDADALAELGARDAEERQQLRRPGQASPDTENLPGVHYPRAPVACSVVCERVKASSVS